MAVCALAVEGYLAITDTPIDSCMGYVVLTATEYDSFFESFSVSPAEIATAITFGFGVIVAFYFFGFPVGQAKKMIGKV